MQTVTLGRGDLRADVIVRQADPGCRFDATGRIPAITYRGIPLCGAEGRDGSGMRGLCCEYRDPVGYGEAGDLFLKVGVGLLRRAAGEETYYLLNHYDVVQPAPLRTCVGPDFVDFYQDAVPFHGYGFTTCRHVAVVGDDMLLVTTRVDNVGEKPLLLREYNHNFLSPNGAGAAPGIHVQFPRGFYVRDNTPGVIPYRDGFTYGENLQSGFMIIRSQGETRPMRWMLRDDNTGIWMQEWGDFPMEQCLCWGGPHVVAPEIYINATVAPGQSRTWLRLWRFGMQ